MTTTINYSDKTNPMLEIEINDYLYKFSVSCVDKKHHEWILKVVSAHMNTIHERAVRDTKYEFRTTAHKLFGIHPFEHSQS